MLSQSRDLLSSKAKKLLYYGQLHSHLCYGIGVWGPMLSVKQMTELSTIQKKCVKLINTSLSTSESFKTLRILTVHQLIELEQSKLGYKLCNKLLPFVLTKLMQSDQHNCTMLKTHHYKTRQKCIPNRPNVKSSLYRKSFLYQAIACYSNLGKDIRDAPNLATFTKHAKLHLNNQ